MEESARTGILLWLAVGVLWTAIPVAVIVAAVNGVRDEIRDLVEALKDLDRDDQPN